MKISNGISIVTAYFDIGRGRWNENEPTSTLKRTNNDYFSYFSRLAQLNNDMVIFTQQKFVDEISHIRGDKPTKIITIDLDNKFKNCITKIHAIQTSADFLKKIPKEQQKNPEYWSPRYVLINNLKTYFVNSAIKNGYIQNKQVAWVDFGYCRTAGTLGDIQTWKYQFDPNHMHFFSIKPTHYLPYIRNPKFPNTLDKAYNAIYNNRCFLIGGMIVGSQTKWAELFTALKQCQNKLLNEGVVDDDQGVYIMCHILYPKLIKINYLGKNNWFAAFQKFHQ